VHGPVVPNVFQEYRKYGWSPILATTAPSEIPAESLGVINDVINTYGDWSAAQLEQLSHEEDPWLKTRGNLPAHVGCNWEISHKAMMDYFSRV